MTKCNRSCRCCGQIGMQDELWGQLSQATNARIGRSNIDDTLEEKDNTIKQLKEENEELFKLLLKALPNLSEGMRQAYLEDREEERWRPFLAAQKESGANNE